MIRKTAKRLPDTRLAWLPGSILLLAAAALAAGSARAQTTDPSELENLVAPIALYPDDVIGIILPASTFPLDIVRAARFLDEVETDPGLQPDEAWDDSIVALLNYPEVLRMMNDDLDWTWALGQAVLTDESAVLDAVQAFRERAYATGNLRTDQKQVVEKDEGAIEIRPADPKVVYIPIYEPAEVIVYHSWPTYSYYPIGYPSYYYPYPAGYYFGVNLFWGVTSYFSVGWHSHLLFVRHYTDHLHPYYLNSYYSYRPYYHRDRVNITVTVNSHNDVWVPSPRRGDRPRTISVDGRSSGVRTPRTTSVETQRNGSTRTRQPVSGAASSSTTRSGRTGRTSETGATAEWSERPSTTRSVESPPAARSATPSTRTRNATPAPTTREPTRTPQTYSPRSGQSSSSSAFSSSRSNSGSNSNPRTYSSSRSNPSSGSSSRSTITTQGSTRRSSTPSVRTPSISSPTVRTPSTSGSAIRAPSTSRSAIRAPSTSRSHSTSTPSRSSSGSQRTIGAVSAPSSTPRSQGATRSSAAPASSSAPRTRQRER